MEPTSDGIKLHVVEDYDRHKIWVNNPLATEISKKAYYDILDEFKINDNEKKNKV